MSERPPPSPAQVALALAATGRVDAAHVLLEIALDEDPGDEECSEARERLMSIERDPLEPEETPRVFLGPPLVDAYLQAGLVREAQVIAQTLWSMTPDDAGAARRVKLFEQALSPLPDDAPADVVRADALLREGALASALLAFRDAGQRANAPAWARARAEALRSLVITRDAPTAIPSRVISSTDDTTRVGRDPRRVLALLHERNLVGAADEAKIAAAAMGGEMATIAQALTRLVEVADRVPRDSPASRSTLPMGRQGVADLHVRMASFDQAIALYRAVVEANPHDDDSREVLSALRVVTRHMRTVTVDQVDSISLQTPSSELTRPVLELAPTVSPALDTTGEMRLPARDEAAAPVYEVVIEEGTEPSSTVERTLRKTGWRPPEGDWATASHSGMSHSGMSRGGDDETAITSPEVAAELALRQGYPERALALYRALARSRPEEPRFAARVASIERTLGLVLDAPEQERIEAPEQERIEAPELPPVGRERQALLISGGAVRSPTGPYRTASRYKPELAGEETRVATAPEAAQMSVSSAGPGPTVSPPSRRDAEGGDAGALLPSLPDLVPSVIATFEAARARSPFDGLDEEETAVNLAAGDLMREGLLVGPSQRSRVDPEPLAPIATRVEELAPPTVRLPAVSEALARQMHPQRHMPAQPRASVALQIPPAAPAAPAEGGPSPPTDEIAPPTVRLQAIDEQALLAAMAEARERAEGERPSVPDAEKPAVARRRIIPIGE